MRKLLLKILRSLFWQNRWRNLQSVFLTVSFVVIMLIWGLFYSCDPSKNYTENGQGNHPSGSAPINLQVVKISPKLLIPGTVLTISGNFPLDLDKYHINCTLEGTLRNIQEKMPFILAFSPEMKDNNTLQWEVPLAIFDQMGSKGKDDFFYDFSGRFEMKLIHKTAKKSGQDSSSITLQFASFIRPQLNISQLDIIYLHQKIILAGNNFIRHKEGTTMLELQGEFIDNLGNKKATHCILDTEVLDRSHLSISFTPLHLGIVPGRFTGNITPTNNGAWKQINRGNQVPISFLLSSPAIYNITPTQVSRGQIILLTGDGFIGSGLPGGGKTTIIAKGNFTLKDGRVISYTKDYFYLKPRVESGQQLSYIVHVNVDEKGKSTDLGALTGTFRGNFSVGIEKDGQKVESSTPFPVQVTILPQRQYVYLKYLPEFTDSLRKFGLRNLESLIRQRIQQVVERDYQLINIQISTLPPIDFEEYVTVEMGGPDPNGIGLLGLENSPGMDYFNRRFDDTIGGYNSESQLYGGIFLESFLHFSPKHPKAYLFASPVFDQVFAPFIKNPVKVSEYPGGSRSEIIGQAIQALGNLVGNTVSHELGHSLGLALEPGCDQYHSSDGINQLMDCGSDRPFEERAELNGQGPQRFSPKHLEYLLTILPKQ